MKSAPAAISAPVLVIAEAGVNHNGSLDLAMALVDSAAESGADAVKFQSFRAEHLLTAAAPKADYQIRTTGVEESQYEMIRRLELDDKAHRALAERARARGIRFLSTPFDSDSLDMLLAMGMEIVKISSGDLTNAPLLLDAARKGGQIILSTGMASLAEIEAALGVLAFGFIGDSAQPVSVAAFSAAYGSCEGQRALRERATLLHCTTEYPAPMAEVNLRVIDTLAAAFGLRCGYSDHTQGIHVSLAAVARGACVIEKHFTLDRGMPGPDHAASLEPDELRTMVAAIRDIEVALGSTIKHATASEQLNKVVARKSLVAARALAVGDPLELTCKRPGNGVSPFDYWRLSGTPAARAYTKDEPIDV